MAPASDAGQRGPARAAAGSTLAEPPLAGIGRALSCLERRREEIDRVIAEARGGRSFNQAELIALQGKVYAYSQEMEVVSRLVDRTVGAVKTTLNTQI